MKRAALVLALLLYTALPAVAAEDTQDLFMAAMVKGDVSAFAALLSKAEAGSAAAEVAIGSYYKTWGDQSAMDHRGVDCDAEAFRWFRKAAEQGDGRGQAAVGTFYQKALGVKQDWQEAYFWISLAAKSPSGEPDAKIRQQTADLMTDARNDIGKHLTADQVTALDKRVADWKPVTAKAE